MNTSTLNLTIQLPKFEGPLGLLLYLIRKEEMNIFDIEINKITAQYLEYIKLMKEFDLEVAGEFIAMASTLIQIKSRMLLPTYNEQGEIVETEDPRKELVQRLLEYQKFQEAAQMLYQRPLLGRDVWPRGMREKFDEGIEEIELEENALYSLISAYRKALKAAQKRYHRVTAKTQSIASRILEMKDRLVLGQRVAMSELVTSVENKRKQILITFLSALELAKLGFVRLFQTDAYQEIYFETVKAIETDAISAVEEYEHLGQQEPPAFLLDSKIEVTEQMRLAPDEDFVLKDEAEKGENLEEPLYAADEMASDDEIAAAEAELASLSGDQSLLVESNLSEDQSLLVESITNGDAPMSVESSLSPDQSLLVESIMSGDQSLLVESIAMDDQSPLVESIVNEDQSASADPGLAATAIELVEANFAIQDINEADMAGVSEVIQATEVFEATEVGVIRAVEVAEVQGVAEDVDTGRSEGEMNGEV